MEISYPSSKRALKYAISIPVSMLLTGLLMGIMAIYLWAEEYISQYSNLPLIVTLLPSIVYALVVRQMNSVCASVASQLTYSENHRTRSAHETSLIVKQVAFGFVNNYLSFFYLLFMKRDLDALRSQLQTVLITNLVVGNLAEAVLPVVMGRIRKVKADESPILTQANLEMYEGTFSEYVEMAIQFGLIALFGFCWPLAPLLAILNNIIEVRSDVYKLCQGYQRPAIRRVANIGVWHDVFVFMSIAAVVTNFGFLAVHIYVYPSAILPHWDIIHKLALVVVIEHVVLGLKVLLARIIPDVPRSVQLAVAREERFLRKNFQLPCIKAHNE
eukprot:TRINITY_DN4353_c0_g2_i6.p1 TRINITY_DN4353_c0_g2~~TRINITY_DN4353_c0_g2_i6.p1  ORF type:complete len:329 (+),score=94.80 TRINITY_DN4353_c0_g2_i6:121-1107(+)